MNSPDSLIKVTNLTCAYGDSVVIDNISFDVRSGEIFIILGGSGCGKSTVLKHMIGLYHPAGGKILVDGDDIGSATGNKRLDILQRIGVMYQMGALFGSMSLLENVCLPLEEFTSMPLEAMNFVARTKLALVGLEGSADKMPSELSGGMLKRGAIARAMALDPKILFLDEPSAGLDPITSAELDELIRSLSRSLGVTFVIVTHELASIFSIADRVIMLDKSTKGIIAEGDPRELREKSDHPIVKSFFQRDISGE
ncbi:ABC transporter ATP-binding protein [Maridesulfovibrio bastinii]|uniref:ABC transporter ATP-binding protein n=1 Tax=Maridesulfovibrio bastinii TaxID=47157 RepID=UPI00040F9A5B|nr:ATP-binding cassette domain-containing protein [Maridesulfovibrio bastinii]